MKILLLENIHECGIEALERDGFQVESLKGSLEPEALIQKLKGIQILGIRSKTMVPKEVIDQCPELIAIGCFCVGTNQVDLEAAKLKGICVFNAPFSNTRSVAELVIAEMIMLARQLGSRNNEMHSGVWNKASSNCFEIRGKSLGIIGYGNIGTQVSMLAESIGLSVFYYDIVSKLSLGNAKPVSTLDELLEVSDFITLHVPETPITKGMIGDKQLLSMRKGSYLINASRGTVVDLESLEKYIKTGHIAGAAIDVFPEEPLKNSNDFPIPLRGISNVVLTPHIGGATEEAQSNIAKEVAQFISLYTRFGISNYAVNFPSLDISQKIKGYRLINVHRNVPGVMRDINQIISKSDANIEAQSLSTDEQIGYVVMDLGKDVAQDVMNEVNQLKTSIRTRLIKKN